MNNRPRHPAALAALLGALLACNCCFTARAAEPAATPAKPVTRVNSVGMKLVRIAAGEFMMGNRESNEELAKAFGEYDKERIEKLDDEKPLHKVRITKPFFLGATEVTR